MRQDLVRQVFEESQEVLNRFMQDSRKIEAIVQAGDMMIKAIEKERKIISFGNGGSMSDAMHFAEELTGRFRNNRPSLPALAISDQGYLSCVANDFGYEEVFSRFIEGLGKAGDVVLAISTSGQSPNVVNAARFAKKNGLGVVALTGNDGGELSKYCDIEIRVEHTGYADRIQEVHIKVIHALIELIESSI